MKYKIVISLVSLILLLCGCEKGADENNNSNNNNNVTSPVSDVVGLEYQSGYRVAKYWKDGVASTLTSGSVDAEALSISVSNGDVFIAGVRQNESGGHNTSYTKRPVYWKNGTVTVLPVADFGVGVSTNTNGLATDVFAVNGIPYVVGYMSDGGLNCFVATQWVNGGSPILLGDPFNEESQAAGVFVSNGKVYVVGYRLMWGLQRQAVLWTDGYETALTSGNLDAYASDVFVEGNDVYVCGREIDSNYVWRAVYWKNGLINYLTNGNGQAEANSIFVYNGDIYVAGSFDSDGNGSSPGATLWKNGILQNLNNSGKATEVVVKNGDVYVSGTGEVACIWKNGNVFELGSGIAEGVFIP